MVFSEQTRQLIQALVYSISKDIEEELEKKIVEHIDAIAKSADEIADKIDRRLNLLILNKELYEKQQKSR